MKRRNFVRRTALAGLGLASSSVVSLARRANFLPNKVPAQAITSGEQQHWFGYYDKWQVDPSGRYALGNQVDLFFRSPTPEDTLKMGLIDLENNNTWTEIGQSSAWGWQQGCMLQWVPGSSEEVIWNARRGDARSENTFVSIICNINTGQRRILPHPVYTLSPDGKTGFGIDFARLQFFRPGYGYATSDKSVPRKAPADTGIYRLDLQTGEKQLVLSYAQVAQIDRPLGSVADNYHWVNHLLVNPAGNRLIFLNRSRPYPTPEEYRKETGKSLRGDDLYVTRAITVNTDGSDLYALNDSGMFSHFIWNGDDALCAWAKPEVARPGLAPLEAGSPEGSDQAAFYVFQDRSKQYEIVCEEAMTVNGHNTYVPHTNNEWILNDTYPQGDERMQELYLYHVPSQRKVVLGRFHEPAKFKGEWRCDLHPRCNQQGTKVYFDSTHEGSKRQMYEINIEEIIRA
ncbi:hypothetical protein [Tunicatimonas pelagia]|uniref:hypothetical protein n=1 Tax=Tunicatimonas pelagia TaxID=931531 RepID=UPI002666C1FB|nr:hypothetical protein [Tunicatimonas pelagia]WKN44874.1 hypothetical protein P0M28_07855 [Tunicatimonas pelagia]